MTWGTGGRAQHSIEAVLGTFLREPVLPCLKLIETELLELRTFASRLSSPIFPSPHAPQSPIFYPMKRNEAIQPRYLEKVAKS